MKLRTKGEQKAYLDGYEMCAECIEKYLTSEGKHILECLLMAVRIAVEIEDIEPQESEKDACKDCYYNDGEVHAECVICDKAESEEQE